MATTNSLSMSFSSSSHNVDSDDPSEESVVEPDPLGIYTGPEADAVLARSHAHWERAMQTASRLRPGEFPSGAFELEGLLHRMPALPNPIPHEKKALSGCSTWGNLDVSCPFGTKTELRQSLILRSEYPCPLRIDDLDNFAVFDGCANNGVAFLMLGWAYILNASLAERQQLSLTAVRVSPKENVAEPTVPRKWKTILHLGDATPEEEQWWKVLTTPRWMFAADELKDSYLRWSIYTEELGNVVVQSSGPAYDEKIHPPSSKMAATYLGRFIAMYDLGNQSPAALSAVMCYHMVCQRRSPTILVPRPKLVQTHGHLDGQGGKKARHHTKLARPIYPPEFHHLSYFMTLSSCTSALNSIFQNIMWDHNVTCNYAGNWTRPMRKILAPLVLSENRELLSKVIISSGVKGSPLWLGLFICGGPRRFLDSIDYYLCFRMTLHVGAWTGIAGSFMAFQPIEPTLRDGRAAREDIWRLQRDLKDEYEVDDYSLEPNGPYAPFGTMELKDIETELHPHLNCVHQWNYVTWTWLHDLSTDAGFQTSLGKVTKDAPQESPVSPDYIAHCVSQYSSQEDLKAIRQTSKTASEWVFKWSGDQVERGFGGHLVPNYPSNEPIPVSDADSDAIDRANKMARTCQWLSGVFLGQDPNTP